MKIATLTFHNAVNYGAVLQAVALQQAIQKRYPDAETGILDYRNPKIEDKFKPFYVKKTKRIDKKIKSVLHACLVYSVRAKKKKSFQKFLTDNARLFPYQTAQEQQFAKETIDRYIVGSDQIWNFDLSGNDETYLLKFIPEREKKSAYAPSIGKTELSEEEIAKLQAIKDFGYLSAREETAMKLIEKIDGRTATLVPDPVFLLSAEDWRNKEERYPKIPENYILVYKFSDNETPLTDFAYRKAKESGKPLVIVQSSMKKYKDATIIRDASPSQFLWLIDNADLIVTNSFHGTAFSILFEKEFYSETKVSRGTRITEILQLYHLNSHRMVNGVPSEEKSASWQEVKAEIQRYREQAFAYLDAVQGRCP